MRRSPVLALLGSLALLVVASSAHAQPSEEDERAEGHFRAATSYFEEEAFEDALREFEAAYRLSGRPELLYNIGLSLERLGRWREAADAHGRFIEAAPDNPNVETARERRDRALRRAEAAERGEPEEREAGEGEPDAPNVDAPPTEPEDDGGPNVLAWSTLGASAAVGVTSLITGVVGHGIAQDLDEDCPGGVCPADRRGDANRGRALARTSTALMFVAAAGAATSLVLFLVGGEDADRPEPAAHLELAPLPGGAFVSARVDL
ncbi:MAG TPA: tetratricopeptide repeat protein [Polyangiaceae bacterium LLY-WYZ-15_(1-7)]|nr:hypothetical protein [Sandaracinus sp.]HJL01669.1 tetratricopeptide repeat protein [Polyangiaceae bacterium LLY-WYZ-15_(1-7)]MBJ71948.1 hypothetical protein [Sandaracinus sp.]HJL08709.1 tetratricopeptide repeat protein [Polyangiaceae bacterium LLY-WYZ-15_(1-7)]HJL23321.1 tetratricopeptide repeat protein [Polyangiaceae bacterium LLY-WYZ-15_(1-7)]